MVKFKSRYILLEIVTSNDSEVHKILKIKKEVLADKILKDANSLFGELGEGKLRVNFQVKYLNDVTNLVIIRTSKESLKMVQTILFLMNSIESMTIRNRILHVSGTINKIEQKASLILRSWIENYELVK